MDNNGRPAQDTPSRSSAPTIRFANDNSLTFVNYGADTGEGFAYRQEARLHNARRRLTRSTSAVDLSSSAAAAATSQERQPRVQQTVTEPLSTPVPISEPVAASAPVPHPSQAIPASPNDLELLSQDALISRQVLESLWRSVFVQSFCLPYLDTPPPGFTNPADSFMTAARSSPDVYRSIVVQPVVAALAKTDQAVREAVFQNQALILRDFRRLADTYRDPSVTLTDVQFQQIFASAFSVSGDGFGQEAAYNAIVFLNAFFMNSPENHTVMQTPVSEWCRMMMPRPGPSFWRSEVYQREMWRKIELALAFFQKIQDDLEVAWPPHVARYLEQDRAVFQVITIGRNLFGRDDNVPDEPFAGFHQINLHRTLSMVYRLLEISSRQSAAESDTVLTTVETLASVSLQFPPTQCLALFLWFLVSYRDAIGLKGDGEEPQFAWAMKELLLFYDFTFVEQMTAWILYKVNPYQFPTTQRMDIVQARAYIQTFYPMYAGR